MPHLIDALNKSQKHLNSMNKFLLKDCFYGVKVVKI